MLLRSCVDSIEAHFYVLSGVTAGFKIVRCGRRSCNVIGCFNGERKEGEKVTDEYMEGDEG